MSINKRLDIYKENFYYELNKREQLKIETNYYVAFILTLFSTTSFFTQKFFTLRISIGLVLIFITFLVLNIVVLIISIFFIIKSSHGHIYRAFRRIDELETFYNELKMYKISCVTKNIDVDNEYFNELIKIFCEDTKINSNINDLRANHLHNARIGIIIATSLTIICSMFFIVNSVQKDFMTNVVFNSIF